MTTIMEVLHESLWLRIPSEELGRVIFKKEKDSVHKVFCGQQNIFQGYCDNLTFVFKAAFLGSPYALQKQADGATSSKTSLESQSIILFTLCSEKS